MKSMRLIVASIIGFFLAIVTVQAVAEVSIKDAFSPSRGATSFILNEIDESKKTILIAAYSFTSRPIAKALVRAHDRGVKISMVVDEKENNHNQLLSQLQAEGVMIHRDNHYAIMHNKFMIFDDETLELGSFNYTKAAEFKNAENVLILKGVPKLIRDYHGEWLRLWNESE